MEEGIYDNIESLPRGWQRTKLGDVINVIRGASPRPKGDPRYFGGDIPWIMISDITREKGKFISQTKDHVTKAGAGKSRYLKAGTLILSNSGTVCVPKILSVDGCIHDGFLAFPELPESFDILYLYYFFEYIRPNIINAHRQGITQVNLNTGIVKDIKLPVAPLEQQKRIVAEIEKQLSRLDEAVASLKRVKANLKRYKAAVLKAAVEGKLTEEWRKQHPDVEPASKLLERILAERRKKWEEAELAKMIAKGKTPKDDKWKKKYKEPAMSDTTALPELPKEWIWTTIGQAFEVCIGATPSRQKLEYWNGKIPWVSSGEVSFCKIKNTRETITEAGLKNSSTILHPVGTVLLGMIGEGKTRGQVAILNIKACNNQNAAAIRVADTEILPEYIYIFLEGEYENTRKRGSGGNQPALNKSRVQQILFPLPPLREQNDIVLEVEKRISNVENLMSVVSANLLRAERLRQSILNKAFSGELMAC